MPDTNTIRSGGMPELGEEALDRREHRVVAAARAPARLLVGLEVGLGQLRSLPYLAAPSPTAAAAGPAPSRTTRRRPGSARAARARAGRCSSPARARARTTRSTSPRFAGSGLQVAQVRRGDPPAALAHAPRAGADRAVARAPAEHQQVRVRVAVRPRRSGTSMPVHLGRAQLGHPLVVGAVVGDVAGAVGLLQAADAVREAGRARDRPRARQIVVARVRAGTACRSAASCGSAGRSPAGRPPTGSATARSSWRGTGRSAGSPACGR